VESNARTTQTIYEDRNQRVIVRRDQNTNGDGALVSVTDYDQLGRVRLTRELENAGQDPDDDSTGIKVQRRYLYSGGVSTSCTTDSNNHTSCNVNISASIAIYATSGSGLTSADLNSAASTIKNSIQTAWSGSFSQDGVSYNVSTDVSVSVASSQSGAMKSGAQNVIGISNGDAIPGVADSYVNPRSLGAAITGGPDTGIWNFNNLGTGVAAHEFTHLLGVDDRTSGAVLSNTNYLNDPSIPHVATPSELLWGVKEATSGVNLWRNAPAHSYMRYGEEWDKPSAYRDQTTVNAPVFGWWK
jgi:hypothetical protein